MAYRRVKPTHFVTIQLTDRQTIKKLCDEQKDIVSRYPQYEDFSKRPSRFHLTLTVLQLDTEADVRDCVSALARARPDIEKLAKSVKPLEFHGLDCFSPRVIFAKVEYSKGFIELVDMIKDVLKASGIKMELKELNPHLTLFSVDKEIYYGRGWPKEKIILASHFDPDPYFGSQPIDNIQVCEMHSTPNEDGETGFYRCTLNIKLEQ